MMKRISVLKSSAIAILILLVSAINIPFVQAAPVDTGLCPPDFDQGLVTTEFVECYDSSSPTSQRIDAEEHRIILEAICLTVPRSQVTSSQIRVNSSGRFYAQVTCTIRLIVPTGTVFCPADADEVLRAFDKVICQYFGMAERTFAQAATAINQQSAACTVLNGSVLESSIESIVVLGRTFYSTSLVCSLTTRTTDIVVCPYGFHESDEDEDQLVCEFSDRTLATLAEAQQTSLAAQNTCTGTTAGLGTVTEVLVGSTSTPSFFAQVECTITKPRYGIFTDSRILRACDESCTESVFQTRQCLNGGTVGGPGCTAPSTQTIDRRCHTGVDRSGLCPLVPTPAYLPSLLLDEEED
jgi:hypothetical protein